MKEVKNINISQSLVAAFIKTKLHWQAFAIALLFALALLSILEPFWQTNDDVGFLMRIEGFGTAAEATELTVASNVLWGRLVSYIPNVGGISGYSLAMLAVVLLVGYSILFTLLRLEKGFFLTILSFALIVTRPFLSPQFTVNAGLLVLAALLWWQLFSRFDSIWALTLGCVLFFLGFLIRWNQSVLVLAVAIPFIPWRAFLVRTSGRIALTSLVLLVFFAFFTNIQAQSGPEWENFRQFKAPRVSIIDYGAANKLSQDVNLLNRHGYSVNDLLLIRGWFFEDPALIDSDALESMIKEIGPRYAHDDSLKNAINSLIALGDNRILFLSLAAIFIVVLLPGWQSFLSWGICLSFLLYFGFIGRPGIMDNV